MPSRRVLEAPPGAIATQPPPPTKLPRLYHKKSRTGCQRCRARRVKCNEARPICGSCRRHCVPCMYDKQPLIPPNANQDYQGGLNASTLHPSSQTPDQLVLLKGCPRHYHQGVGLEPLQNITATTALGATGLFSLSESAPRRKLELRLMQNYIANTCTTFPACHNPEVLSTWSIEVPKLALHHDNVLYEMLSISALHLLKSDPDNLELLGARQSYVGLSLHEHRRAVSELSKENAEAVCLASTMILIDAFASLQDRTLKPYTPPMEWLQMALGAGSVFSVAVHAITNDDNARIMAIIKASPQLKDSNVLFAPENRTPLLTTLLNQEPPFNNEPWLPTTQNAYEQTLSYIGGIQAAIATSEHPMGICRRMMAFPLLVPKIFLSFVEQHRPRALVILSYFFLLAATLENMWWVGPTAKREIGGIWTVLPSEWRALMAEPMALAQLDML